MREFPLDKELNSSGEYTGTLQVMVDDGVTEKPRSAIISFPQGSSLDFNVILNAARIAKTTQLPTGLIVMWSGTVANVPTGWALCDGTNGTPDLQGCFIVGAHRNAVGGKSDELEPEYEVGEEAGFNWIGGESTNPLYTDADETAAGGGVESGADVPYQGGPDVSTPNHQHGIPIMDVQGNKILDGVSGLYAADNRPVWYALCLIMKT